MTAKVATFEFDGSGWERAKVLIEAAIRSAGGFDPHVVDAQDDAPLGDGALCPGCHAARLKRSRSPRIDGKLYHRLGCPNPDCLEVLVVAAVDRTKNFLPDLGTKRDSRSGSSVSIG